MPDYKYADLFEMAFLERLFGPNEVEANLPDEEEAIPDIPEKNRHRQPRRSDNRNCRSRSCPFDKFEAERRRRREKERALKEAQLEAAEMDEDAQDEDMPPIATIEDGIKFTPCGAAIYVGSTDHLKPDFTY